MIESFRQRQSGFLQGLGESFRHRADLWGSRGAGQGSGWWCAQKL